MSKVNIVLDASMIDLFQLCEARFNYRHNLNRVAVEKAKPLDRGTLVHSGLEAYYSHLKTEGYTAATKSMVDAVNLEAATSDLEPDVCKRVVDVLYEYTAHWKMSDQNVEVLEVERSFSYVLYEDDDVRIIMSGKIDLLINDDKYHHMPWDHKSYDREYPSRRMTNQFCNYAIATESNYLLVNKIGFQTSLKPEQKFKRVPLSYDPLFLAQWKENTIKWVFRYLEDVATDSWPMNLTSCDKYNRLCEYYDVCDASGEEAKVYKLHANFKEGEVWDVSKRLGLEKDKEKEIVS